MFLCIHDQIHTFFNTQFFVCRNISDIGRADAEKDVSTKNLIRSTYAKFSAVARNAVDCLTCILCKGASALFSKDFVVDYILKEDYFLSIINAMIEDFDTGFKALLHESAASEMLLIFARKIVIIFLHIIREAALSRPGCFTPQMCSRFIQDVQKIKALLLGQCTKEDTMDEIEAYFQVAKKS